MLRRILPALLLVVHAGLLAWAILGLAEWWAPAVPWSRVSNPAFPRWLLLLHWGTVACGALAFLGGYLARWSATPLAVSVAYMGMGTVCVVETFGYLTNSTRFVAMAAELAAYVTIALLLRRLPAFAERWRAGPGGVRLARVG